MNKLRVFGLLAISLVVFSLGSCATYYPLTKRVLSDVQGNIMYGGRQGFRFHVSKGITMERVNWQSPTIDRRQTSLQLRTEEERIILTGNTPGRLQRPPGRDGSLDVSFENRPGDPTLRFVNRSNHDDGRFYLSWVTASMAGGNWFLDLQTNRRVIMFNGVMYQIDTEDGWLIEPVSGRRVIWYNNAIYTVDFRDGEEPYLLYRSRGRERSTTRWMSGIR